MKLYNSECFKSLLFIHLYFGIASEYVSSMEPMDSVEICVESERKMAGRTREREKIVATIQATVPIFTATENV